MDSQLWWVSQFFYVRSKIKYPDERASSIKSTTKKSYTIRLVLKIYDLKQHLVRKFLIVSLLPWLILCIALTHATPAIQGRCEQSYQIDLVYSLLQEVWLIPWVNAWLALVTMHICQIRLEFLKNTQGFLYVLRQLSIHCMGLTFWHTRSCRTEMKYPPLYHYFLLMITWST